MNHFKALVLLFCLASVLFSLSEAWFNSGRVEQSKNGKRGYKMSSKKSDYASDRLGMAEDDTVRMKARRYHVREQDNQPNWK
ncbi:hypothetical protein ABFA07_013931 [Porites harrisoni]